MVGDGDFPKKSRKVPPADSARNFFQEEVVGNKTDAAVTSPTTTKSLMAYTKGALNQLSTIITRLGELMDVHQNVVSWSDVNRSVRFEISLIDKDDGGIPSGNITAGTYVIQRNRHKAISAFADAGGGDVTVTSSSHGLSNGDEVTITGTTNYDGTYTISGVALNTFDITASWVATETGLWNAWQEIVATTAFSKATGLVYTDYFFDEDDWATDDIFKVTPSGISVTIGGKAYYPAVTSWLGTIQDTSTIEGKIDTVDDKVDAIQADIGDPSTRTNFQDLETMIGIPDAADSNLDDILRTGFDSSGISNNFDGSIMEIAKAGLEKDTAGAFDADTDSNEAISEAVGGVSTDLSTLQGDVDEIPSEANAKTFNATALASIKTTTDGLLTEDLGGFIFNIDSLKGRILERLDAKVSEVKKQVCVTTDPADSISKLLKDNLNAPVGSIPTTPTLQATWTDAKAAFVDSKISEVKLQVCDTADPASSISKLLKDNLNAPVGSIPTNPLLDTANGSTFTAIPAPTNMALDTTVAKEATLATVDGIVDDIKTQTDKLAGATPGVGTTTANWNAAEADIVSIGANDTKNKIHSLFISLHALTAAATITIRMYAQINGTERQFYQENFVVGTDTPGQMLINGTLGVHEVIRVTAQSDDATDDGLGIDYDFMVEVM